MKMEERYGFEEALETDRRVWAVFPKIQVRLIRSMLGAKKDMEGLAECLTTRLALENFEFQARKEDNDLRISISKCPWHDMMVKYGREALSERVGTTICNAEYQTWASEFGYDIFFLQEAQICKGDETCVLRFTTAP